MENLVFNGVRISQCSGGIIFNGTTVNSVVFNGTQVYERLWAPGAPTGFNATDTTCDGVTFTFSAPADVGNPACRYDLYSGATLIASNITSGHYLAMQQLAGISYHVKAVNTCAPAGVSSNTNSGSSRWAPTAPTGFLASDNRCGDVRMTWSAPGNTGNPACTYNVYRGGTLIAANVASGWTYGAALQSIQTYSVRAINACSITGVASGTDTGIPNWAPLAPTGFSATDADSTGVTCTWTNPANVGNPGAVYSVLRNGVVIANNATSGYKDTTAVSSVVYSYSVRATNICGSATSTPDNGGKPVAYSWGEVYLSTGGTGIYLLEEGGSGTPGSGTTISSGSVIAGSVSYEGWTFTFNGNDVGTATGPCGETTSISTATGAAGIDYIVCGVDVIVCPDTCFGGAANEGMISLSTGTWSG